MGKNLEILKQHATSEPSKWREKAEERKKDRVWLKKSREVAMKILEALDLKNMSQKQLAERLGVSPQYISKIVKGNENFCFKTVCEIEKVLGIDIILINPVMILLNVKNVYMNPSFSGIREKKDTMVLLNRENYYNYNSSDCNNVA